ncbi:MAG: hypothetical protein WCK70_09405 [Chloroflexales bacterium]|jgi:hypothetical protein
MMLSMNTHINTRTTRMFASMIVAIMLMFAGDVVWNISGDGSDVTQSSYPITFHQALIIAGDTAPHMTVVGTPDLISYKGTTAYAVTLNTGAIYVEATTGRILLNTVSTAMTGGQSH